MMIPVPHPWLRSKNTRSIQKYSLPAVRLLILVTSQNAPPTLQDRLWRVLIARRSSNTTANPNTP